METNISFFKFNLLSRKTDRSTLNDCIAFLSLLNLVRRAGVLARLLEKIVAPYILSTRIILYINENEYSRQ